LHPGLVVQIVSDTHPLYYLYINVTLMQFDEFNNLYCIQSSDGMYAAPEDRVAVW
jgi:putative endopeptidase